MDSNVKGVPITDDEFNIELLPEDYAQYDISFKIIVIGDSSVGKSCLTTQAVRNNFEEFYLQQLRNGKGMNLPLRVAVEL